MRLSYMTGTENERASKKEKEELDLVRMECDKIILITSQELKQHN